MNRVVTSKEAILKTCREIVSEKGLSTLNMRTVATACHIALGSLYNYFPSKDDLITATIESVWQDIFKMKHPCKTDLSFPEYVEWFFESVQRGIKEYPNFFTTHSLSLASAGKNKARESMDYYLLHMKTGMLNVLHNDKRIKKQPFCDTFTEAEFIDFILGNLIMLLVQQKEDCHVLLEMIRCAIYSQ